MSDVRHDGHDGLSLGAAGELDTISRASPPRHVKYVKYVKYVMRTGHLGHLGHLSPPEGFEISAPVQRRTCSSFIPKARPLGDSSAGKPRKVCDGPCKTPSSRSTPVTVCHCVSLCVTATPQLAASQWQNNCEVILL
jgi:hypothetical protein